MEVKEEILSWEGTRWRHLQSVKGEGVDCIQFPVAVARNLGWLPPKFQTIKYPRDWAAHNDHSVLLEELGKVATKLPILKEDIVYSNELEPGDIIVMVMEKTAGHAGLYLEKGMFLHAHIRRGVVLEPITLYKDNLHSVWRFHKCL